MELIQYYRVLKKRWLMILLITLIAGTGTGIVMSQLPARYSSTATLLLSPALTREALLADPALVTNRLAATYAQYLNTRAFAELVIREAGLTYSAEDLIKATDAGTVADTQFFEITATTNSPEEAQYLANTVSNYFLSEILNQQREQERLRQATTEANEQQARLWANLETERQYYTVQVATLRGQVDELQLQPRSSQEDEQLALLLTRLTGYEASLREILSSQATLQPETSNAQINAVTLIESAPLPTDSDDIGLVPTILYAILASLVLAGAFAVGLEYLDFTVKSPEDLELLYAAPPLGVLVQSSTHEREAIERLFVLEKPRSSLAEAFRALRTSLQFSSLGRDIRSLVITSAGPSEGKTTVACNLAITLAQAGKRVILVDGDMRRPTVHKHFNLSNKIGFSSLILVDHLSDPAVVESHLQPTMVANLSVMTSGPHPPNPAELLSLERTRQVQTALKDAADIVIYDSPPVVTVTDAAILASRTDATIQVVRAGKTRRDLVLKARQTLERVGATVLGTVLNGVQQQDIGYYYYYYDNQYIDPSSGQSGNSDTGATLDSTIPTVASTPT
jgi:succinoglycan biosynthesis transport protein ExoP